MASPALGFGVGRFGGGALFCLYRAGRLPARRGGADYVYPCASRVARAFHLCLCHLCQHYGFGVGASAGIFCRPCRRAHWGGLHLNMFGHGRDMGATDLGVWWVWDARLTSVLVLFFIYLGYMAIWAAIEEPLQAAKTASLLAIIGFVNVPIVKFSVDWWHTLHQPASISRFAAPAIHPDILLPLLVCAAAFQILFFALWLTRMQSEILRQRIRARRLGLEEGDA